jgi:hypothetical protein
MGGMQAMYVFRIHLRPRGGLANNELSFSYCIKNRVMGVGWQIPKEPDEKIDWETYEKRALALKENKGKIPIVKYIKKWVSEGDLIWTRDTKGIYYLGKVLSGWEYLDNPEAREADIVNIVRVDIKKVGSVDEVPGKVIACFRGSRTIQEIANQQAILYSKKLWNKLSEENQYPIDENNVNIWDLLNDEQVEDLIFIYLQFQNWYVIPNSRKKDTMNYEFYLINRETFQRAKVQAKTGNSIINRDDTDNDIYFLFQPNGKFIGNEKDNIIEIENEELINFVKNNKRIIPFNILRWFEELQTN